MALAPRLLSVFVEVNRRTLFGYTFAAHTRTHTHTHMLESRSLSDRADLLGLAHPEATQEQRHQHDAQQLVPAVSRPSSAPQPKCARVKKRACRQCQSQRQAALRRRRRSHP